MGERRPYDVVVVPGDGIGPEITEAAIRVLEATGVRIAWREALAGEAARERHGHRCRTRRWPPCGRPGWPSRGRCSRRSKPGE